MIARPAASTATSPLNQSGTGAPFKVTSQGKMNRNIAPEQ
jgi:hypothetical protein